jgi:hypothetical protein
VASCDVNLHRGFADGELERGLQRGVELLSAWEMVLWSGACLLANGKERRWLGHFKGATPVHGAPGPWRWRRECGGLLFGDLGGEVCRRGIMPRRGCTRASPAAGQHGNDVICHAFDRRTGLGVEVGVLGGGRSWRGSCLRGAGARCCARLVVQVHRSASVERPAWPCQCRRARRPLGVTTAGQRERVEEGRHDIV